MKKSKWSDECSPEKREVLYNLDGGSTVLIDQYPKDLIESENLPFIGCVRECEYQSRCEVITLEYSKDNRKHFCLRSFIWDSREFAYLDCFFVISKVLSDECSDSDHQKYGSDIQLMKDMNDSKGISPIVRLSGDYTLVSRSDPYALHYPIQVCRDTSMLWPDHWVESKKDFDRRLSKSLRNLGQKQNDYRTGEPIQNVIDPDLFAKRLDRNSYLHRLIRELCFNAKDVSAVMDAIDGGTDIPATVPSHDPKHRGHPRRIMDPRAIDALRQYCADPKALMRGTYQWIPSLMERESDGSYHFSTSIHSLLFPRSDFEQLYSDVECLFNLIFIPMLNRMDSFRSLSTDQRSTLRCFVKSQRYAIKDGTGYEGVWHSEGLTEQIKYVCLYYFEWNNGLKGGNIRFRNHKNPPYWQIGMRQAQRPFERRTELLRKHSAVVFDNTALYHKVQTLKNIRKDKKVRRRGFIALFICDPLSSDPVMPTHREYPSLLRSHFIQSVSETVLKKGIHLPSEISGLICEMAGSGETIQSAKEWRDRCIENRKSVKGKWGETHYGNAGEVRYYPMGLSLPMEFDRRKGYPTPWIRTPERWVPTSGSSSANETALEHKTMVCDLT